MLSYFFYFFVGIIIISILKSMFRLISYKKEYDNHPDYISVKSFGRSLNFNTKESELQETAATDL